MRWTDDLLVERLKFHQNVSCIQTFGNMKKTITIKEKEMFKTMNMIRA